MLFAVLSLPPEANATCGAATDRPSVGLVLSGGGARGAAHIGVIEVLEQLRVPIDCVAGTSMGAIVGGLYAAGYGAEELEDIILSIDWPDAFRDDPSRRDLTFRRRQDDYEYLIALDLGFREGRVRLPKGLVQGQKLGLLLRGFAAPVSSVRRFDELPTPYRAVATDAEDGSMVVLGGGDLSEAMRASMAAPGIFAPMEIDGRILIDGGISNNLPIRVARDMGADIIIAVDIGFPLLPRDDLDSAIALSNQALTILIRRESEKELRSLGASDVVILPKLGLLGSADFSRIPEIIALGTDAARKAEAALRKLSVSEARYADYLAQRGQALIRDQRKLASVTINDDSRIARRVLSSRLLTKAGAPLDAENLKRDLARIYGLGLYESVDYQVLGDPPNLVINARQKSWGPNFLNFGLTVTHDFEGASNYNFGLRFTRTQLNPLGAEWRTDLQFGDNPRLFSEFFQPLGHASQFFVAPQIELQEFNSEAFDDIGNVFAEFRVSEARFGADVGYFFNNSSEVRFGISYSTGRATPSIGDPALGRIDFDSGNLRLDYQFDNLDTVRFPRRGARGLVSVESRRTFLGADQRLDQITLDWSGVRTTSKDISFVGRILAQSNLGGDGRVADLFDLGGLFNLSGYRTGQLRDQHAFLSSLTVYRRIGLGANFNLPLYIGGSVEAGNVWSDSSDIGVDSLRYGGSAFIGLDTPVGPLLFGYGVAEGGDTAAYFFLGPTFGSRPAGR